MPELEGQGTGWFQVLEAGKGPVSSDLMDEVVSGLGLNVAYKVFSDNAWPTPEGGIELTGLEVTLVDLPEFQRLRWILQLGPSHLVFPTATHTRFQHSLGTVYAATLMLRSCRRNRAEWDRTTAELTLLGSRTSVRAISPYCRFITRLAALLHDLAHIPYAHTLENEGHLFTTEWDDTDLRDRFLPSPSPKKEREAPGSGVVPMALYSFIADRINQRIGGATAKQKAEVAALLSWTISQHLRYILAGWKVPEHERRPKSKTERGQARPCAFAPPEGFDWLLVSADIVGNTLCADLIDYVRRDNHNTGLEDRVNLRFMRYFVARDVATCCHVGAEKEDRMLPRLVLALFKPKKPEVQRLDSLSEAVDLLRKRFSLAQKVYYHHTKKAAAAMICRAVGLSGLLPRDIWEEGDHSLLSRIRDGTSVHPTGADDKTKADRKDRAKALAKAVLERKLYKIVHESSYMHEPATPNDKPLVELQEEISNLGTAPAQEELEETLADAAGVANGSVLVYSPRPGMNLKVFEALVWSPKPMGVQFLEEVEDVKDQVTTIMKEHQRLWQVTFLVLPSLSEESRAKVKTAAEALLAGDRHRLRELIISSNSVQLEKELGLAHHLGVIEMGKIASAMDERADASASSGRRPPDNYEFALLAARTVLNAG